MAAGFRGIRFNSLSDLTVDSQGQVQFRDPRHGSRNGTGALDSSGSVVEGCSGSTAAVERHGSSLTNSIDLPVSRSPGLPRDEHLFVADDNNDSVRDRALSSGLTRQPATRAQSLHRSVQTRSYRRRPDGTNSQPRVPGGHSAPTSAG